MRIAAGEPLGIEQDEIDVVGHAIEMRLVAEDPARGWLPSTGEVVEWEPGWRPDDSAVRAGSVVTSDYDSLITNVVAWGPDRAGARSTMRSILRGIRVSGIVTDLETLLAIVDEPDFVGGATTTSYLDEHPEVSTAGVLAGDDLVTHLIGVVLADERRNRTADRVTGFAPSGWRNLRIAGQRRTWLLDAASHAVEYVIDGDEAAFAIGDWPTPGADGALATDTRRHVLVRIIDRDESRQVFEFDGVRRVVEATTDDGEPPAEARAVR